MEAKEERTGILILVVLVVIALITQGMGLVSSDGLVTDKITNGVMCVGLLAGLVYVCSGAIKDAMTFYKTFMIIYAVVMLYQVYANIALYSALSATNTSFMNVCNIFGIIQAVLSTVCLAFLAFAKDFGKKKSQLFALLNLILVCVAAVLFAVSFGTFVRCIICAGNVILAIVAFLFVKYKYVDKDARGTK